MDEPPPKYSNVASRDIITLGFVILISLIVITIVILWLYTGIDTNPNNYGQWVSQPGPCINNRQAIRLVCSDTELGCLSTDGTVSINDQYTFQSCTPGSARARWSIEQTADQTIWTCISTGRSGPNLCTLAESGNPINSSSVDLQAQPIGTMITVNSRQLPDQNQSLAAVDNQLIWASNCKPFPNQPFPNRPLVEGTLGPVPEKLNWSNFQGGLYPLAKLLSQDSQLCRRFPDPQFGPQTCGLYYQFVQQPVIIAINQQWQGADAFMLLPYRTINQDKMEVFILNIDRSYWWTPDNKQWPLATSYPWIKGEYTSQDILKAKGQWTLCKQDIPQREYVSGAPKTVTQYLDVQCLENQQLLRLARCVDL